MGAGRGLRGRLAAGAVGAPAQAAPDAPCFVASRFSALVASQLVLAGHDTLRRIRSSAPLLARIAAAQGPLRADVPFYQVRMYDQTLPFISVAP